MKAIAPIELVFQSVESEINQNGWRYGQALFNSTYLYYPDFCDDRVGTENDPFYKDNPLDFVCQRWVHELKCYIEDLLEAEQSASNKP